MKAALSAFSVGNFIVVDGAVQLTDANGKPLKDATPEVLADGVNPKSIVARMTRARWSETRGGFNRKLAPGFARHSP